MNNIRINLILIALCATVTSFHAMEKNSWSSHMYKKVSDAGAWAKQKVYSSPLVAGYNSTAVQKEAALEKIRELLFEKDQLQDLLNNSDAGTKDKQNAKDRIIQIDYEIHTQKIITGDKWSKTRKLIVGAGVGLTALGAGAAVLYGKHGSRVSIPDFDPIIDQPLMYTFKTFSLKSGTRLDKDCIIKFSSNAASETSLYKKLGIPEYPGGYIWAYWDEAKNQYLNLTSQNSSTSLGLNKGEFVKEEYVLFRMNDLEDYKKGEAIVLKYYPKTMAFPSVVVVFPEE